MGYLIAHWRGAFSLGRACWINFIAPRAVIYLALSALLLVEFIPLPAFLALLCADIAVLAWQVVGVIRAGEAHMIGSGAMAPVWGSYLLILWVLFACGAQWLGLYQRTIPKPHEEMFATKMERLHASTYDLLLSQDGTVLLLKGDIAPGATKVVRKLLDDKPSIALLVLDSTGGNIYEARGVARYVREHGLDTHIDGECSSACTIIFISGRNRTMAQEARLGFHQYRLNMTAVIPLVDVAEEQERDRALFERQAVSREFLDRIFLSPHNEIWYPGRDELLAAGVLTR